MLSEKDNKPLYFELNTDIQLLEFLAQTLIYFSCHLPVK